MQLVQLATNDSKARDGMVELCNQQSLLSEAETLQTATNGGKMNGLKRHTKF